MHYQPANVTYVALPVLSLDRMVRNGTGQEAAPDLSGMVHLAQVAQSGSCGSSKAKSLLSQISSMLAHNDWKKQKDWIIRRVDGYVASLKQLGCNVTVGSGGTTSSSGGGGTSSGQSSGGQTAGTSGSCTTTKAKSLLGQIDKMLVHNDWSKQKHWIVKRVDGYVVSLKQLGCNVTVGSGGTTSSSGGGTSSGQSSGGQTAGTSGSCTTTKAKSLLGQIDKMLVHNDWSKQKHWIVKRVDGYVTSLKQLGCSVNIAGGGSTTSGDGTTSSSGGGGTSNGQSSGGGVTVDASGAADIGVHTGGSDPNQIRNFEKLTSADVRVWNNFIGYKSGWGPIENGWSSLKKFKNYKASNGPLTINISYAPFPSSEGKGKGPLQKCASGSYNHHYAKFARSLKAIGLNDAIINPLWEYNHTSFPWGAGNDNGLLNLVAGCYRQVVTTIRNNYPGSKLKFAFTSTQAASTTQLNAAWPGSSYVTYVGSDTYDRDFNKSCNNPQCQWNATHANLKRILNFAKGKGKPLVIPEWGVWAGDSTGGGDSPYYIQQMAKFFRDNKSRIAYHIYFNVKSTGDHRLSANPKSLAAYKQAFGR